MTQDDRRADLLRQFQAIIGGAEFDDLRQLGGALSRLGVRPGERARPQRPELRRPRLAELRLFVLRVDLQRSKPPIWRRLEVRSDLTLDVVHRVLQAAFGWMDSHLWRFSLGGDRFSPESQVFLCAWDVEEGEWDDEGGIPAANVRLDEVLQLPGEVLSYAYDYGDNWELTLRLENVLPATADAPSAVAVDGRRAAPPEDCGGRRTADELAEVLEDPSQFDLSEVNEALRNPFFVLREHGLDRRLVALIDQLTYSLVAEDLASRALSLLDERPVPNDKALHAVLSPFIWFLDQAAQGGFPLTASGYLKPVDVTAAAEVVPAMQEWIGKANREIETTPVLHFRKALQELGLLRKHKGSLLLTRAGHHSRAAWQNLWNHLADRLVPNTDGFDTDATLLLLLYAATSPGSDLPFDTIAAALTHLGWESQDGTPIVGEDLYRLRALEVLRNVTTAPFSRGDRWRISDEGAELARAALRTR
ncbi:MAG: plasmid pRiA4b ORF-3 family protein [Solirubrobacteraceae bacterium]